jgi:hypothetical protein
LPYTSVKGNPKREHRRRTPAYSTDSDQPENEVILYENTKALKNVAVEDRGLETMRVDLDDPRKDLWGPLSLLDYNQRYIVDHNIKVRFVGKISKSSQAAFLRKYKSIYSEGPRVAEEDPEEYLSGDAPRPLPKASYSHAECDCGLGCMPGTGCQARPKLFPRGSCPCGRGCMAGGGCQSVHPTKVMTSRLTTVVTMVNTEGSATAGLRSCSGRTDILTPTINRITIPPA